MPCLCINLPVTKRQSNKAVFLVVLNILTILGGTAFWAAFFATLIVFKASCSHHESLMSLRSYSTNDGSQHKDQFKLVTENIWSWSVECDEREPKLEHGWLLKSDLAPSLSFVLMKCVHSMLQLTVYDDALYLPTSLLLVMIQTLFITTSYLTHYLFIATAQLFSLAKSLPLQRLRFMMM